MTSSSRTLRLAYHLSRIAGINERIDLLAKKYAKQNITPGFIEFLLNSDPTGERGDYLEWLIRQTLKKAFAGFEIREVKEILKKYDDFKRTPKKAKGQGLNLDINTYKTFSDLRDAILGAEGIAQVIYNTPPYKVIKINDPLDTQETMGKAINVACYYGKETSWCTKNPEASNEYLSGGPLYIILRGGKPYAQCSPEGNYHDYMELMDVHNDDLLYENDPELYKILGDLQIIPEREYFKILMENNALTSNHLEAISSDPELSYDYAETLGQRFPLGESAIAQSPRYSVFYAVKIIKGRFPEGEKTIAEDDKWAYEYSAKIIKGPFPAGERVIAENSEYSFLYAQDTLGSRRFPLGEPVISKDPRYSFFYARDIIKGSFPAGEPAIARVSNYACRYACDILKHRFPLGEPAIMNRYNAECGHTYSQMFLNGLSLQDFLKNST